MRSHRPRPHEWVLYACVLALLGALALRRSGLRAPGADQALAAAPTVQSDSGTADR